MTAFTDQFGLPAINYTRVVYGSNPGIISGAESEAELDLQWAHAAAPGASIVYHLGSNLVTDISGAVTDNACGAISISYAFCGPSASLIENTMDPLFKQAAAQGQSVFVSAGDEGAAGLTLMSGNSCVVSSSRSVNEMSADPNVTSVGGTQFTPTYSGGNDSGYATEQVWNDGSGATGGGASQFFAKPGYQTGSGVPNDGARDVPDIALIASPEFSRSVLGPRRERHRDDVMLHRRHQSCRRRYGRDFLASSRSSAATRLGNLNPIIYRLANTQYDTRGFSRRHQRQQQLQWRDGIHGRPRLRSGHRMGHDRFQCLRQCGEELARGECDPDAYCDARPSRHDANRQCSTPTTSATPTNIYLADADANQSRHADADLLRNSSHPLPLPFRRRRRLRPRRRRSWQPPLRFIRDIDDDANRYRRLYDPPRRRSPNRRRYVERACRSSLSGHRSRDAGGAADHAHRNRSSSSTLTLDIGTLASPVHGLRRGPLFRAAGPSVPVTIVFSPGCRRDGQSDRCRSVAAIRSIHCER